MRLIDADALRAGTCAECALVGEKCLGDECDWDSIKHIDEAPTVDAVPRVSAYWRTLKDGSLECTNCLGISPHDENYNGDIICNYETDYCPWCGAKMDGGAEP